MTGINNRHFLFVVIQLLLAFTSVCTAKATIRGWQVHQDTVPLEIDSGTTSGRLENGFTYYIKRNNFPANKIMLKLVVKCGYFNELPDQLHLSHVLEHIAFTKTGDVDNVWNTLVSIGLQPGVDFNAHTGFKATEYWINIPSNNPRALSTCLKIIKGWCSEIILDSASIEHGRQTVLTEIGRPAETFRNRPPIFNDSIINKSHGDIVSSVSSFDTFSVLNLYRERYRPHLQSLIVVGDIDAKQVEREIKALLNDLDAGHDTTHWTPRPSQITPYGQWAMALKGEDQISIQRLFRTAGFSLITENDYLRLIAGELLNEVFTARLRNSLYVLDRNIALVSYESQRNILYSDGKCDAFVSVAQINNVKSKSLIRHAVKQFLSIENDLLSGPIEESEVTDAKRTLLAKNMFYSDSSSTWWADRLREHFLLNDAAPSASFFKDRMPQLVASISMSQLHVARATWQGGHVDTYIQADSTHKSLMPDSVEFLKWARQAARTKPRVRQIKNYNHLPKINSCCPGDKYSTNQITNDTQNSYFITTVSGIEIALKPLFGNHQIQIRAYRPADCPGNRHGDSDALYAIPSILNQTELKGMSKSEWNELKKRYGLSLSYFLEYDQSGVIVSGNPGALETALRVLAQALYNTRFTRKSFNKVRKSTLKSDIGMMTPYDSLIAKLYKSHDAIKRYKYTLERVTFAAARDIYQQTYPKNGSYRIVITGPFDMEQAKILIKCYLNCNGEGTKMDTTIQADRPKPSSATLSYGVISQGADSSKVINLHWFSDGRFGDTFNAQRTVLKDIFQQRLFAILRDQMASVYYVFVTERYLPMDKYQISVAFNTNRLNHMELVDVVLREAQRLSEDYVSAEEIKTAKQAAGDRFATLIQSNDFWQQYFSAGGFVEKSAEPTNSYFHLLEAVNEDQIHKSAKEHLNLNNTVKLVPLEL